MLEFDRIDISEGIVINKINASKWFDICRYWFYLVKILNMSHIFAMVSDIAIVLVKGSDYRVHFWYISKN